MRLHAVWPIGHAQTANIAVRDMTRDSANGPINAVLRKFEFPHRAHHRRPIGVGSDTACNVRRRFAQAIPLVARLSSSLCETHTGAGRKCFCKVVVISYLHNRGVLPRAKRIKNAEFPEAEAAGKA